MEEYLVSMQKAIEEAIAKGELSEEAILEVGELAEEFDAILGEELLEEAAEDGVEDAFGLADETLILSLNEWAVENLEEGVVKKLIQKYHKARQTYHAKRIYSSQAKSVASRAKRDSYKEKSGVLNKIVASAYNELAKHQSRDKTHHLAKRFLHKWQGRKTY